MPAAFHNEQIKFGFTRHPSPEKIGSSSSVQAPFVPGSDHLKEDPDNFILVYDIILGLAVVRRNCARVDLVVITKL